MKKPWRTWSDILLTIFFTGRMTYVRDESKISYQSKDGREEKTFDALEWIVPPAAGFPCPEQGRADDARLWPLQQNWVSLIQKIYEVDPLTCPKCQNQMKITNVIEDNYLYYDKEYPDALSS